MRDFEYEVPTTIAEAVQILSSHKGRAKPLAGGTDLIDYIRTGRLSPDVVVDLKQISELKTLVVTETQLKLGAAVTCQQINNHTTIKKYFSALSDACSIIGGMQIQNRATVGGNLCTSGAAADSMPALIALNASCEIHGPRGIEHLRVEDFVTGPAKNVLHPDQILVSINFTNHIARTGSCYQRFIPRNEMDIAVVGVGAALTLDEQGKISDSRIGLGAVAPIPFYAREISEYLQGQYPIGDVFQHAGEIARTLVSPIDDHRGTIEFRTHVVGVLVQRVLTVAASRASGSEN